MVNTRRRTIATNRRTSMAGPLVDTSNATNRKTTNGASTKGTSRTRKQRQSMIPRMAGSSSTDNHHPSSKNSKNLHSLTPGKPVAVGRKSMSHYNGSLTDRNTVLSSPHHSSSHSRPSSSIPPPVTMRTDTRPISDKAYFNNCVRNLHTYLEKNNYEHPIKLKDLAKPSGKDFHNIMLFLLSKCDPSFYAIHGNGNSSGSTASGGRHKFEDDVAMMFKTLGYPFNISKTALVAAGSPHTWPSLLLAITWLIELLDTMSDEYLYEDDIITMWNNDGAIISSESEYIFHGIGPAGEQKLDENKTLMIDLDKMEQRIDVAIQRFLERSYQSFLFGDDDLYDKMENDILEYVDADFNMIVKAVERTTEENELIVEEVMSVQKDSEE